MRTIARIMKEHRRTYVRGPFAGCMNPMADAEQASPRPVLFLLLLLLAAAISPAPASAVEALRIAAWNLEHLNDNGTEGCVLREQEDYDAIAHAVMELDATVVAFQEVKNEAAARRIFPPATWHVEMSARPDRGPGNPCRNRPEARLAHLATGFAIRRDVSYRRNPDLTALGKHNPFQRWATDVTITRGGRDLRLLSIHLQTGCWGSPQDRQSRRTRTCEVLRRQVLILKAWADARRREGIAFVILGDFNRRLAVSSDWAWQILSPPSAPLHLATSGQATRCDPRYSEYIDHLVLDDRAADMAVENSFHERPRHGPHPDHCAVSVEFSLAATGIGGARKQDRRPHQPDGVSGR